MGVGQNVRQFASAPISEAPDENCSSARMSQGSKATTPWEDRRRPQRWSSERQACLPQAPLSACYRRAGACASAAVSHHSVPQPSATWDLLEDRTVIKNGGGDAAVEGTSRKRPIVRNRGCTTMPDVRGVASGVANAFLLEGRAGLDHVTPCLGGRWNSRNGGDRHRKFGALKRLFFDPVECGALS